LTVPYFRIDISEEEIAEVADSLRSGWLTTGPKVQRFETAFAKAVGVKHALALNSCTAALHLALEAIGLRRGDLVVVPTMTFAATAEVIRYFDAIPVFVDCGDDFNLNPHYLKDTLAKILGNEPVSGLKPPYGRVKAIIPMHYGGYCCDMLSMSKIAKDFNIELIEDSAHAFPSYFRSDNSGEWIHAGKFGKVGCFSFYANKCITTGEGGMAVTDDAELAHRMRVMSLHGMSRDAWKRYTDQGSWYYEILAPGFKYNMTDIAAALGLKQLEKANRFQQLRKNIADCYNLAFNANPALQIPPADSSSRRHSWHLYSLRLNLDLLTIDRKQFIEELKKRGLGCSVHWMPLHLHPYYREHYNYHKGLFPKAESLWLRQISLPIYPSMTEAERDYVIESVEAVSKEFGK
jgi:perosamine synthetase